LTPPDWSSISRWSNSTYLTNLSYSKLWFGQVGSSGDFYGVLPCATV
jgi:hypothetical protein